MSMKWWVFNEEQLEAALKAYVEIAATDTGRRLLTEQDVEPIRHFLYSEFAKLHKLRGDREATPRGVADQTETASRFVEAGGCAPPVGVTE